MARMTSLSSNFIFNYRAYKVFVNKYIENKRFIVGLLFVFPFSPALPWLLEIAEHGHCYAAELWQACAASGFPRYVGARDRPQFRFTGEYTQLGERVTSLSIFHR